MILTALLIVMMMISVATLLAYTSITSVQLLKEDFSNDVAEISSNFRGALAIALTEVSNELDFKASIRVYMNYSTLEDAPEAAEKGRELMADWQKTVLLRYTGRNLNLSVSDLNFECLWNSSQAYSRASANLALDIPIYGFYGWKDTSIVELSLQISDLKEREGNVTSFYIILQKENNLPVSDLMSSSVKILYLKERENSTGFAEADPSTIEVTYLGCGSYLVEFGNHTRMAMPPRIKMVLRDKRGIAVGAFPQNGIVLSYGNDTVGPRTINVVAYPNPCDGKSSIKLTATIDDLTSGWHNIISAEYFVDTIGSNGSGMPMYASDGSFDFPTENVKAYLNVSTWDLGNYTLYVHGKDAAGNWGNVSSVVLEITDVLLMHIASIDMDTETRGWWIFREVRGVAEVTVVYGEENPVEGAIVYGHWSGSVSGNVYGETGADGRVTFKSGWISWSRWTRGGSFTFTVDDIVKEGWIYDESSNVETSDTITP